MIQLVPIVTGQINQGFGWQNWGQIIVLSKDGREYQGCWSTGHMARWYAKTGGEVGNRMARIAPNDLAELNEFYITPIPDEVTR